VSGARRILTRIRLPLIALFVASACASAAASTRASLPPVVATLPASGTAAAATATTTPSPKTTAPAGVSAAASASPASSASGSSGQSLVAAGKVAFLTINGDGCAACHGADAKGMSKDGNTAPNIRGATEQKFRDALRGGVPLMSNIKITDDQIAAVLAYLAYLDQQ